MYYIVCLHMDSNLGKKCGGSQYYRGSSNSMDVCPKFFEYYSKPHYMYLNLYLVQAEKLHYCVVRNRANFIIKLNILGHTKKLAALMAAL